MILAFVRDAGVPQTPSSIASALPILRERTKKAMQRLAKDNRLVRTEHGFAAGAGVGTFFTDRTEAAPSPQLPETLAGVRVLLLQENRDPVAARLYIVTPNQINFVVPDELGPGTYSVEVRRGDTLVATGVVSLETVAPALFTAGASGVGAPAAWALNIAADGKQTLLPVVDCGSGACEPGWIDVGAAGERVFLLLFGTGLRGRTSTDGVVATIGNRKIPVMAAVAQSEYAGLDQVNVELPPDLAGAGLVDLLITGDGVQSNRVKLRIR